MAPLVPKTAVSAASGTASSRVIVKNLPKHATEDRLREFAAAAGEVTDCRLRRTKDGKTRQFAFVGFRTEAGAKEAVKKLNRSFFDTARIAVEFAHAPGSEALARPWSRHAPGSKAHQKQHPELYQNGAKGGKPENRIAEVPAPRKPEFKAPRGARIKQSNVTPRKAGVSAQRTHMEFASSGEEEEDNNEKGSTPVADGKRETRDANGLAFDDTLSDLAYLRAKSARQDISIQETENRSKGQAQEGAEKNLSDEGETEAPDNEEEQADKQGSDVLPTQNEKQSRGVPNIPADSLGASDDREELESSGRLYVTNLPYGATEEEVWAHFEPLGEVASVYICKDEDTAKSRGFGYVTYVFTECAVRAISELDMSSFQGRLLRIAPARAQPPPVDVDSTAPSEKKNSNSYKRQREQRKKKVEAHLEHTWNLLYVSANVAVDVASNQLGVKKGDILGKDAENAAVTAALTETSVIQQTKLWLKKEGIRVDAFEQKGASLAKSKAVDNADNKRRDDTFLVKHLPAGATSAELRERFARYGELVRCSLAPSGTVAIVQYTEKTHAQRAFQKLAFSRFRHVPLYLEWAPEDVFDGSQPVEMKDDTEGKVTEAGDDEADDDGEAGGCLFVKNLSFGTTEASLKAAFTSFKGFRKAIVMRKKAAVSSTNAQSKDKSAGQSMGYGFLEFVSAAAASEALRRRQGFVLDGHALQLQVSQRKVGGSNQERQSATPKNKKGKGATLASSRLCVRNLAFEATRKELSQLFGAYGSLTAVRIPKKSDYSGHRGFAFIDFASKSEAAAAFEALQHTHLYGRRLVIEPAEEKATDVAAVQKTAKKRQASRELRSEAKKRKVASVLNTSGEAGSFEDALV